MTLSLRYLGSQATRQHFRLAWTWSWKTTTFFSLSLSTVEFPQWVLFNASSNQTMSISKMMMRRTKNEIANANGFLLISFPFFSLSVFQFSNISLAAVFIVFTSFFNKRKNSFSFPHFPVAPGEFTLRPKVEFNSAKELCNFKTNCLHLCTREREREKGYENCSSWLSGETRNCVVFCVFHWG